MEENLKLEKIKKSCKVGENVTKFFFVFSIILGICCLICITIILYMGKDFESFIQKGVDAGYITYESAVGTAKAVNITIMNPDNIYSDVQAVRDILASRPYSMVFILYSSVGCLIFVVMAVMMKLVGGAFGLIREEDSPFTDKVIRKIMTVMITASVIMFFCPGTVFGILGLILTWIVNTIMDYGKTLQIQSDETL